MPPIAQYVFNGIVTGGILALPAVAFSLLWRLLRFPNFAVSTYLTVGAYAALVLNAGVHVPLELAWLGALAATGAVALAVDRIAFRPMRDRRPFSLAIASIGVAFVLENVVRFVWGNDFRAYDVPVSRAASVAGLRAARGSASRCARRPTIRCWPPSRASRPIASSRSPPSAAARSPAGPASSSAWTRASIR